MASIPAGRVATYGQIAHYAGWPNYARQVGSTLKQLPTETKLPWFRVVNASGKLSFPETSASYIEQKRKLEKEGIIFNGNRFSLKQFQWQP